MTGPSGCEEVIRTASGGSPAMSSQVSSPRPFVVEYYYTARWGHADEFLDLFRKNHWPVLKRQIEGGRFLRVEASRPRYHTTEDGRWDYRITITFRDVPAAHEHADEEAIKRDLFPDQETFRR